MSWARKMFALQTIPASQDVCSKRLCMSSLVQGKESHLNRLFVEDNSGAIELELFCYVQNLLEVWNRKRELVEECDLDRLVEGP